MKGKLKKLLAGLLAVCMLATLLPLTTLAAEARSDEPAPAEVVLDQDAPAADEPAETPADESADEPDGEVAEAPADEDAGDTVETPAGEIAEEPTDDADQADAPADEEADAPADEDVSSDEAAEAPSDDETDAPADEDKDVPSDEAEPTDPADETEDSTEDEDAEVELMVLDVADSACIFVDGTNGSNSNGGTRTAPVKTLDAALNKVTSTKRTLVLLGDTTYSDYLGSNAATNGRSITICSDSADDIHTVTVQRYDTSPINSQFHLKDNRSLTLENVTICCAENNRDSAYGLFFLDSGSTLTIKEGVTLENIAARVVNIRAGATVYMEGGLITGNTAGRNDTYGVDNYNGTDAAGAAVYICPNGKFIMTGGAITGNYSEKGGAVYAENNGVFQVSGNAVVSGNYISADSRQGADVYLGNYGGTLANIQVIGALTDEGQIGVFAESMPDEATPVKAIAVGASDYTVTAEDATHLFSNKPTTAGVRLRDAEKESDASVAANSIVLATDMAIGKYQVAGGDDKGYEFLADALAAAQTLGDGATVTITEPGAILEDESGTLPGGVTLVDAFGSSFSGAGVGVTVQAKTGRVILTSGSTTVTPSAEKDGDFGVQVTTEEGGTHDVLVPAGTGAFTVDAASGDLSGVKPEDQVTVDGVTLTGAESYNVDQPMKDGVTAIVPEGKGLTIPEATELQTTKGEVTVTGGVPENGKTTVDIPAGSEAKVGGKTYTGPARLELDEEGNITERAPDLYVKADAPAGGNGTLAHPYNTLPAAATAAATYGGNIYILSDLTLTSGVTFSADKTFTIQSRNEDGTDLGEDDAPWTVTRGSSFKSASMVTVSKGDVTFKDVTFDGGSFTVDLKQKGGILEQTGGHVTLGAGATLQNSYNLSGTSYSPGGVRVCGAGAVLDMVDGAIIQNNQANVDGGGLIVQRGTVNIKGGEIRYNTSLSYAAGIYATTTVAGQSTHQSGYVSIINITGGSIHDNYMSSTDGGGGAGILIALQGQVKMTGGIVTHNGAAAKSGSSAGITIWENTTGDGGVTVGGTAVIRDNYIGATRNADGTVNYANGSESNIYLRKSGSNVAKSLTVSGGEDALASGAYIGISVQSPTGNGNEVIATGTENLNSSARYFHSDNSDYVVRPQKDSNTKLVLGKAVYLVWDDDGVPNYYDTWEEAQAKAAGLTGEKTVYLVGKPASAQDVDLAAAGVTLTLDKTGDVYSGGTVTVETDGTISVPAGEGEGNTTTLTPGFNSKGASVSTGAAGATKHTVAGVAGSEDTVEITAKENEDGSVTGTAKSASGVVIDGVTYTGAGDDTYDLDDPFGNGATASVPDGKSVTVPGDESGKGFVVTNPANSDGDDVTVEVPGADGAKGTVTAPKDGGQVSVQAGGGSAVTYDLDAGAQLALKSEADGETVREYVELEKGSATVPNGGTLAGNGKEVTVTAGSASATKESDGSVRFTVPSGGKITVDGQTYTGATTVVIDEDGTVREVLPDYYVDAAAEAGGNGSLAAPFKTVQNAVDAAKNGRGANIHIMSDIDTASTIAIAASGKSFNFDSVDESGAPVSGDDRHTVKITSSANTTALMNITAGNVTVKNLVLDGNSARTVNMNYGHHIVVNGSGATLTLGEGAKVTGFNEGTKGGNCNGAVTVVYGTLIMLDGAEISGNSGPYGAGVKVGSIDDGSKAYSGTFRMEGGLITNNETTASGTSYGGAVYLWGSSASSAKLIMTGGSITGNTNTNASTSGGGSVAGVTNYKGTVTVSGSATIDSNTCADEAEANLYTTSGNVFKVDGPLTGTVSLLGTDLQATNSADENAKLAVGQGKIVADNEKMQAVYSDGTSEYTGKDGSLVEVVSDKAHGKVGLWLVADVTIPTVYVGGTVTDPSAAKGSKENPYPSLEAMLEDTGFAPNGRLLNVSLGGDIAATADQVEELMGKTASLTFTTEPDVEPVPTLTVEPGADGSGVTVGSKESLTLEGVTVKPSDDFTGNLFTVDEGGKLAMDGATLSGAENVRGVYVNGGDLTLNDTTITGFTAPADSLDGKGDGVYFADGSVTLSGDVVVTGNDSGSNVYLAEDQTLTLDGLGDKAEVEVATETLAALGTRSVATGAQPGDEGKIKSGVASHETFFQNGQIVLGHGSHKSYYVRSNGAAWSDGGDVGTAANPIKPSEIDKVSGDFVEFYLMDDVTMDKANSTEVTAPSDEGNNYGMRIVSSQFRIVSVYEKDGNWVQVTDPSDAAHIHTITRGNDIPAGAPMFWAVGTGGIELAYVNVKGGNGPVLKASGDQQAATVHANAGTAIFTGVSITGGTYTGGASTYGSAPASVIDFESNGGTLTLTDTTISGNTVGGTGAVYVGGAATVTVDGATAVTGNTANRAAKNVVLQKGETVSVAADFAGKVGVTVAEGVEGTPVASAADGADISAKTRYFTSDNADYVVRPGEAASQLVLGTGVYRVDDQYYMTWDDAKAALEAAEDQTVYLVGAPAESQSADLGSGDSAVTLVDEATGDRYTGGQVTVNGAEAATDSAVTVTGGTTSYTQGAESGAHGPAVQTGTADAPTSHQVSTQAGETVDLTVSTEGGATKATAQVGDPADPVVIDGVTYTGATEYDLDDPMSRPNVTGTIPGGDHESAVQVGDFTVKNPGNTDIEVRSNGEGENPSVVLDGGEGGQITIQGEDGETTYKAGPDGAELELGQDKDGNSQVEVKDGSVVLSPEDTVAVNDVVVENKGPNDVTVSRDPETGMGSVDIPAGTTATVGGVEYTGPTTVAVGEDGNTAMSEGEVTLQPGSGVDVAFPGGGSAHVENPADSGKDVTVKVPASPEDPRGQATVPAGGSVTVTDPETGKTNTYTVPDGAADDDNVFYFGPDGGASIVDGAVELSDGHSVGFGEAELGNGDGGNGKVVVEAQPGGDAKVTVPAGETLTVTTPVVDENGDPVLDDSGKPVTETHTYTNNGPDALELTVDEQGNVSVDTLPEDGLTLGPNATVTLTDPDGGNANTLTAGDEGATLKPNGSGGSNPPLLDSGSVIFPETGGKSNVLVNGDSDLEKRLDGKNVEIAVGENGEITAEAVPGSGNGKVTVEGGTEYNIPEGKGPATLNDQGVFGAPAQGRVKDNKDGPGKWPYVLAPKDENQELYTLEGAAGTSSSAVHMEPGATFDIHEKRDPDLPDGDNGASKAKENLKDSIGTYQAAEGGADVTVDHENGMVTLDQGSLHVSGSGESKEGQNRSGNGAVVQVGENVLETPDAIVTATTGADGEPDGGADVKLPAGGDADSTLTVGGKDGKTYKNAGDGELELHVDPDGSVELKDGKVYVPEGGAVTVGGVTYTGEATVETLPDGSVRYESSDPGHSAATFTTPDGDVVEIQPGAGGITVTDDGEKLTFTADDDKLTVNGETYKTQDQTTLSVDKATGEVTLESGTVTTPDTEAGGQVNFTTGGETTHSASGRDVTVTKDATAATVTVPASGTATVDDTEYTNPNSDAEQTLTFRVGGPNAPELNGQPLPELQTGAVELDAKNGEAPAKNEAVAVNGATVEATKDGTDGAKNTVTKNEDGTATVDIPAGGKAKVNGAEIQGPAEVVVGEDGTATITPEPGGSVEIDGKTYTLKDDAPEGSKLVIYEDGSVATDPADAFDVEVKLPQDDSDKLVHVRPGETVHFTDADGNTTTVTGGENGGYFSVDKDGNLTLTDASGEKLTGALSNAASSPEDGDLELTLDSTVDEQGHITDASAQLTGGVVHVDPDATVAVDGKGYTGAQPDGADLAYQTKADGSADAPALQSGGVIPEAEAPVQVGGNRYTPHTDNAEIGYGNGKGSVKSADGEDAKLAFQGGGEGAREREYLIPGDASAVRPNTADTALPAPAQEELTREPTPLGKDETPSAKLSEDSADGARAYLAENAEGTHDLTVEPGAKVDVTGKDGTVTTLENTDPSDPAKDAKLTLDADGAATLHEGTVTVTGQTADGQSGGTVTVDGIDPDKGSIAGDGITVTAPGADAAGAAEANSADVTVPAGGQVTVGGTTYQNAGTDELELHVNKDGDVDLRSGTAEVPAGGRVSVTDENGKTNSYTVPEGKTAQVEKTPAGGELKDGAVELEKGSEIGVNNATVEGAKDGADGAKTVVEKNDDGSATVDIPAGGSGKVNGAEIQGPAQVTVGEDGKATITPEAGESVEIDGKTYSLKDGQTGEIVINADGTVTTDPASAFDVGVELPQDGNDKLVHVRPGETVHFTDPATGKTTSVTGGEKGGTFAVDQYGNLTLTDESGEIGANGKVTPNNGIFQNAGSGDLDLTLDDQTVTLNDGAVHVSPDAAVTVDGTAFTGAQPDGATLTGGGAADGAPQVTEGAATVTPGAGVSFDIQGKDGQTHTYTGVTDETTFRVTPDGVELEKGSALLDKNDSLNFGDSAITGSGEEGQGQVTVTVPAAQGSGNAKVEVAPNGAVSVGGDTYTNGSADADLTLEVTPAGDVALKDGAVTLPDNGTAADTASVTVTVGQGDNSRDYEVSGDGVTVTADGQTGRGRARIPGGFAAQLMDPATGETNTYTAPQGKDADVLLGENGPELSGGAVELEKNSQIGANGATVTATQDGADGGKVTVEKNADGTATVDIPAGGKAEVNGVEVQGPATVTVGEDGAATVKPGAGKSAVVGGVTYTDDGTGNGQVTIGPDGVISANDSVKGGLTLPARDVKLPVNGAVRYETPDGETVTLKGGQPDGATVDVDETGDVTVKSGNALVKGDVAAAVDPSAPAGSKATHVGDVDVTVKGKDGNPVPGAKVTVKVTDGAGNVTERAVTTDANGVAHFEDLPYGVYAVEVEKGEGDDAVTCTGSVTVDRPSQSGDDVTFTLDTVTINTRVESDLDVAPSVGNLGDVVTAADKVGSGTGSDITIDVTLTANKLAEDQTQTRQDILDAALKALPNAAPAFTNYVDITVTKTVTTVDSAGNVTERTDPMTRTPALLTITFPIFQDLADALAQRGLNAAENLLVYRLHNGRVEAMRMVTPEYGPSSSVECYFVRQVGETWYITLRTQSFSVYAFGVSNEKVDIWTPSSGGSVGGGGSSRRTESGVTVPATQHGTVTVTPADPAANSGATVTVKPDDGYELGSLVVTDAQGNRVPLTKNADGTYSFTMPASGGVTVSALFVLAAGTCPKDAACPLHPFGDVDVNAWYHDGVHYCLARDILRGYDNGSFGPADGLTRGMAAQLLYNLAGRPAVAENATFPDVRADAWYAPAIAWAQAQGIVKGYGNGSFGPEDLITREQFAVLVYRCEGSPAADQTALTFPDASGVSDWAAEAMAWLVANGVLQGNENGLLTPGSNITRAETATIVMRWLERK